MVYRMAMATIPKVPRLNDIKPTNKQKVILPPSVYRNPKLDAIIFITDFKYVCSLQHINKQNARTYKAKNILATFVWATSDKPAATPMIIAPIE